MGESVFSFRVDSILKWRVYIKLKVSWLRAFLWCMSQTSLDWVNSRRVRTHEKNSRDAVRRLGTIIQSIFVPNQEPAFAWPFGNGRWKSVPRGSSACAWKLSSGLFFRPKWLPLGLRGCSLPRETETTGKITLKLTLCKHKEINYRIPHFPSSFQSILFSYNIKN